MKGFTLTEILVIIGSVKGWDSDCPFKADLVKKLQDEEHSYKTENIKEKKE